VTGRQDFRQSIQPGQHQWSPAERHWLQVDHSTAADCCRLITTSPCQLNVVISHSFYSKILMVPLLANFCSISLLSGLITAEFCIRQPTVRNSLPVMGKSQSNLTVKSQINQQIDWNHLAKSQISNSSFSSNLKSSSDKFQIKSQSLIFVLNMTLLFTYFPYHQTQCGTCTVSCCNTGSQSLRTKLHAKQQCCHCHPTSANLNLTTSPLRDNGGHLPPHHHPMLKLVTFRV